MLNLYVCSEYQIDELFQNFHLIEMKLENFFFPSFLPVQTLFYGEEGSSSTSALQLPFQLLLNLYLKA